MDQGLTSQIEERKLQLLRQREVEVISHTDRIFCTLLAFQWLVGIAIAVIFSPKAWQGVASSIQLNVWLAIVLGGTISGLPIFCALTFPGKAFSRHLIAIGQALTSALFIHLTAGRVETHFHIFGSLALLAFYRDPKVLLTATFVVIGDHILRGMYWPQSVYGVVDANQWKWVELFGWIVFENIFLFLAIQYNKKEMMELVSKQAEFEVSRANNTPAIETQEIKDQKNVVKELEKAQADAEKATDRKNGFASTMSYEIRTPMNGVLGMLDLMLDGDLTEEQRDLANTARMSAESLLDVLNKILDFSKNDYRQSEDIASTVKSLHLPQLQPDIRILRILVLDENEVSRVVLQELLASWGIRNDAATDLTELMEALKSAARSGDPYDVAVVSLSDSDIGLLTQNIKATPALWTTKLILLRSMQNDKFISPEKESRFEACLSKPFRASQLMDVLTGIVEARKQLAELTSQHTKSLLRASKRQQFSARVLVVEDNILNQKVAKHTLERLGCNVNVAGNGKEAIEILNLFPYDIVFMDCEMPVLDGFNATQEIRRNHPRENIPIVAMTARAMRGDRERCLMAGMDGYLSKPVGPLDFESALQQWAPQTAIQDPVYSHVRTTFESELPDQHISGKLQDLAQIMDPPELASLIDEFLTSCRQYISGMKHACSEVRPDYLRMHAHSLKGSSLYIGANRVADLCMKLEKLGMNKDMVASKDLIAKLEEEFEKLQGYLQQEKDSILKLPVL
jgi:CheY-like chemotaxis protein/HPt (histidine-containing phosphotransfer) domain-containing protein